MKKILSSKVAAGVMVLLFLMETSMRPSEACRVLIKGREGARAVMKEPSLIVLQSLQKGTTPTPGNGGYTPGSSTTASTTGTKAFAGRSAVGVPPHDCFGCVPRSMQPSEACRVLIKGCEGARAVNKEPSLIVLQSLQKGTTPTPGNGGYTPGSSTTGTKAFAGRSAVGVPPHDCFGCVPRSMQPSEACRVLIKGREGARAVNKEPSLIVLQSLQKGTTPTPGNGGYTPGSSTTGTKAFAGRSAVGMPPHDCFGCVPRSMQPSEACRVLIKGCEGVWAVNKEPSLIVLQSLQKGTTPSPGNGGYTPGSSTTASTTGTKAFAGRSAVGVPSHDYFGCVPRSMRPSEACRVLIMGCKGVQAVNKEPSPIVLQSLQMGTTPSPGNGGYTPGSSTTDTKAFAGRLAVGVPPHDYFGCVPRSGVAADCK